MPGQRSIRRISLAKTCKLWKCRVRRELVSSGTFSISSPRVRVRILRYSLLQCLLFRIAGALHGALNSGALATTFTASQGLLLYIPNLYKIAGELLPTVIHVASRALAGEALSIYGDHSDTMLVRGCGLALISSFSVQEAHDMAVISQIATLESRVPFLHFMDGFRTSHEINKIELVSDEQLRDLMPYQRIEEHRQRSLSPMHPT